MKPWKDLMYGYLSYDNPMSVNYKGRKKDKVASSSAQEKVESKAKEDRKIASEKRREKIKELKRDRKKLEMLKKNKNIDVKINGRGR